MKVTCLRKMKYKETFIYVMQFGYIFQYLFAWDDEVFQDHIIVKPNLVSRFLYKIGFKNPYTKEQVETSEEIILSGAMRSIDKLFESGTTNKNRGGRRRKLSKIAKNKEKKCQWQVRGKDLEKPFYVCLTHGAAVEMEDGVEPKHDN